MLPVTLQFIVAMIAYAINERMARRVDYLREFIAEPRERAGAPAPPPDLGVRSPHPSATTTGRGSASAAWRTVGEQVL